MGSLGADSLNFLGIGPGELLLILILALIIFGPRRLPEIGRALGKSIREFRQASEELTEQFREELQAASDELQGASEALKGEKTEGGRESVEGAQELKG
jgi:TatA/E family protein of Tat protein translocase